MLVFLIKRLMVMIPTLWVLVTLTFIVLRFVPGGPFDEEKKLPPEVQKSIEEKYNLHLPIHQQYVLYIKDILRGDLGLSYKYVGRNVTDILSDTFVVSMELGMLAIIVAILLGIPMGMLSAYNHNTWWDASAMFSAIVGVALPNFLVGAIFILIFAHHLGWFPPALWEGSLWSNPEYRILPAVTLGIRPAAIIARLTRGSILEVIKTDYIRTARAKGVSEKMIMVKHVLMNSLIPVITILGPLTAAVVTGSFVIEHVFAIPGMGKHLIMAVTNRDYPIIMGTTLIYAILLMTANILVDIAYGMIDPRIKLS